MTESEQFSFREAIPRNRDDYSVTDHLMRRVRTNGRFITEGIVRDLITNGELKGNRPGKGGWVFENTYDGVKFRLICDIGADLEARVVTGVSEIVDRDEAIASDRWGKHVVHQVELRSALSTSGNEVDRHVMEKLECVRPIDVKGHRLITALNWDYAQCTNCGLKTRSKSELAGTPCR